MGLTLRESTGSGERLALAWNALAMLPAWSIPDMPPTLTTSRLWLRPYEETDRKGFLILNRDGEVRRHMGGPLAEPRAMELFETFLGTTGRAAWAVVEQATGRYVGHAYLSPASGQDGEVELGFMFVADACGQGYGTELAARLLRYAFEGFDYDSVFATVDEEHLASTKVLEKAGMVLASRGCDDLGSYRTYLAHRETWKAGFASSHD